MSGLAPPDALPAGTAAGGGLGRDALFLGIVLVACITLSPFPDLNGADTVLLSSGNDGLIYVVFGLMAAAAGGVMWGAERPALRALATPSMLAFAGWLAITCVISEDVATSLKRVAITGFAALCAVSLFLLPRDRDDLARLLSIAVSIILALCYFGVLFIPHLAIHQATDAGEPQLAGDWRGVFGHKNAAGAVLSVCAFVGLFVLRTGRREGWALLVLSLVFVTFSGGKSATALCTATMLFSALSLRIRNPVLWGTLVFLPLVLLNLLGIGSALYPPLASLSQALPIDATFTGRTDIWAFAAPEVARKPLFGHGIGAFWNTETRRYGSEQSTIWAGQAEHAHNGYLDAAMSMGFPGLVLMLAALALQPARDLRRCAERGDEPALTLMLTQIWMFSLYLGSLESFFLERGNAQWVLFLFAVAGGRYLACFRLAP